MYKKYWPILRKYKWSLFASPLLVLVTVLCETIQPYLMSQIVDREVMESDIGFITRVGTWMVLIAVAGLAVSIFNVWVSSRASIGFGTDLRSSLFQQIQRFAFPEIDRFSPSSLITRLTNDITKIQQVILMSMRVMLRAPLMFLVSIVFVIRINPRLALILVAAIPVLGVAIYVVLKKGFPFF